MFQKLFILAQASTPEVPAPSPVFIICSLLVGVVAIAGMWKVFAKAGQPGWAAIIPIYNFIILLKIGGKPLWWIILMFIPIANLVVLIILSIAVAGKFGKGTGFGLGLAFLYFIFYPILGFGSAQYQGAAAPTA
jgi:Family of unknown function (DUF5684)